jgi:hypothetical protein
MRHILTVVFFPINLIFVYLSQRVMGGKVDSVHIVVSHSVRIQKPFKYY